MVKEHLVVLVLPSGGGRRVVHYHKGCYRLVQPAGPLGQNLAPVKGKVLHGWLSRARGWSSWEVDHAA